VDLPEFALERWFARFGFAVRWNLCAGAEEARLVLSGALARPGARAVAVVPAYQSLHEVARAAGAEVPIVQLNAASTNWTLDLDRLREAVRPGAGVVMVNSPNNPTGAMASSFATAHPDDLGWTAPHGGTTAFPRLLRHPDAEAFALALARDHDALILPGAVFGADPDRFRLGLGRRDLAPGLDRLSAALTA
jgi:aspartate/methionine/tyrosine aminotransferase